MPNTSRPDGVLRAKGDGTDRGRIQPTRRSGLLEDRGFSEVASQRRRRSPLPQDGRGRGGHEPVSPRRVSGSATCRHRWRGFCSSHSSFIRRTGFSEPPECWSLEPETLSGPSLGLPRQPAGDVLVLPLIWAIAAQFFRGVAGRYNALVEASAWGRWEEVLQRVDSVGRQVPPEELAFRKARRWRVWEGSRGASRWLNRFRMARSCRNGCTGPECRTSTHRETARARDERGRDGPGTGPRERDRAAGRGPPDGKTATRPPTSPGTAGEGSHSCPQRRAPALRHVHRRDDPTGRGTSARRPASDGRRVPQGSGVPPCLAPDRSANWTSFTPISPWRARARETWRRRGATMIWRNPGSSP